MNAWRWAELALLVALLPCLATVLRGEPLARFVGLQVATGIATLLLACDALAQREEAFLDLPLVLATLSFGGGLVFVRFLERWL